MSQSNAVSSYIAFVGSRVVASGGLAKVLPVLKARFDKDRSELVLIFEVETGRQLDFDLRGTPEEVMARALPPSPEEGPRGPGRPKLGVASREISMLPRHWDWLELQPSGTSATLRRLVDAAIKNDPHAERSAGRRAVAALGQVLMGVAGDRPNYEEATRALFAGDGARFEQLIAKWPKDIRTFALERAQKALRRVATP